MYFGCAVSIAQCIASRIVCEMAVWGTGESSGDPVSVVAFNSRIWLNIPTVVCKEKKYFKLKSDESKKVESWNRTCSNSNKTWWFLLELFVLILILYLFSYLSFPSFIMHIILFSRIFIIPTPVKICRFISFASPRPRPKMAGDYCGNGFPSARLGTFETIVALADLFEDCPGGSSSAALPSGTSPAAELLSLWPTSAIIA